MEILKVKERRLNEELIGYMINSKIFIPIGSESQELKEWLNTNIVEPEYTEEEIKIAEINSQIQEAKTYLDNTDYKMLPNYVPKADEDLDAIIVKRNETREFIRNNNA